MPFISYEWVPDDLDKAEDSGLLFWMIFFYSQVCWLNWDRPPSSVIYVFASHLSAVVPDWYASFSAQAENDLGSQLWRVRREMFPDQPIAESTGHLSVLELGKMWLETCCRFHNCDKSNGRVDPTWYPKRLVCVINPTSPRLVETIAEPPISRYATLSHCWGSEPNFVTLMTNNLHEFHKGIPITALPQSFRDAIFICERLLIQYIWIDSLCIIQDSKSDWLVHTEEMSSIYQNCCLNLSFDAATNLREGAFRHRKTDILQQCYAYSIIPRLRPQKRIGIQNQCDTDSGSSGSSLADALSDKSTKSSSVYENLDRNGQMGANLINQQLAKTERPLRCLILAPEFDSASRIWKLPLSRRGWVVQERLLSPRVLHFTSDRITWECDQSPLLHEALPDGPPETGKRFDADLDHPFNCFPEGKPHLTQWRHFHRWYRIVYHYSDCLLTYPEKDKLVAFAAVAQRFSAVFGEEYYAGHFRENMLFDLVWHVRKRHSDKAPSKRRRPTWSWTSVDAQILYQTAFTRTLVEIESVSVTLLDPSHKYGPVKDGQLRIRCLVTRCILGPYQGERKHNDIWTVQLQEILGHNDHFAPMDLIVSMDGRERKVEGDVYIIPMLEYTSGEKRDIFGLVLLRQVDGFYNRVGSWTVRSDFPDLKCGPMFEVVDKYLDCRQTVVIV